MIPLKVKSQVGFTSKRIVEWPDGSEHEIDTPEEYEEKVKDFLSHEKFMKDAYKHAKELEKEKDD